ncbi:MAG TPA: hypothetical protein VL527_15665 [Dongiaceae bacterium]|jgi:hypothetical protein|nr:hypothetical protein [Dongiaceae bacterium]
MKTKTNKLLQDVREWNYFPQRAILTKPSALYLMRLRAQLTDRPGLSRRQSIPVTFKGGEKFHAEPVKITHL